MTSVARRFLWLLPLVLIAAGCSTKKESTDPANVELMKTDMEFSRAVAVRGLPAMLEEYLDQEAVQLLPNAFALIGKGSILENAQRTHGAHITRTPMKAEVAASGDFGYTWGSAQIAVTYPTGVSTVQSAKYVTVWRKNSDGQWRIVADISNQTPVPTDT